MKPTLKIFLTLLVFGFLFSSQCVETQKIKRLKRPSSRVIISRVETCVRESFDLYDQECRFDNYIATRKSLSDNYPIAGNRMKTIGKGESEPVTSNAIPQGRVKNSRVEFVKI